MARDKAEPREQEILRIAALLGEGDDDLDREGIRRELENSGIDPAQTTARFHEGVERLAENVRRAGQTVPLALQQAIAQTEPSVVSAKRRFSESDAVHAFAEHWLDRFLAPIALPTHLEASRAYRKVGNLAEQDQQDLDRLATELHEQARRSQSDKEPDWPALVSAEFLKRFGVDCGKRLNEVASGLGLEVRYREAESYEGALLRVPGSRLGYIVLNSKIKEESRRRFTLAHEIGHHVLPGQQELSMPCLAGRIENWQRALDPAERAANRFAAEILMPRQAIREWLEAEPSLDAVQSIAAACETSLTSSAVRLMTLTAYPAAVVWSQEAKVRWYTPSASLVRWVRKGRLHEATLAARWMRGESLPKQPEAVPAEAWFFEKGLRPGASVWESAIGLPAYGAVLSLLALREPIIEGKRSS
jgi:Zn-dependent peptidase ImmA (M78 family)